MQYQSLKNRKLFFEASNLSKHLMKNLQMTINVISDKDETEEADDPPEQTFQNMSSLSQAFPKTLRHKGKEKNISSNNPRNI